MHRNFLRPALLAVAAGLMFSTSAAFAAPVASGSAASETGRWITESGNLEVEIALCGQALCGTVVKVLANRSMSRPNEMVVPADGRSALGMVILSAFKPSGDGEWKGHIYNRENGKSYDCQMRLLGPDQLKLRGYKFLPIFGKTQVWHRASSGDAQ